MVFARVVVDPGAPVGYESAEFSGVGIHSSWRLINYARFVAPLIIGSLVRHRLTVLEKY
jgi:hypothetical protein